MEHGASCTCDDCMEKDERLYTVWHDDEELTCEGCGKTLHLNGETLCSMCAEAGPLFN